MTLIVVGVGPDWPVGTLPPELSYADARDAGAVLVTRPDGPGFVLKDRRGREGEIAAGEVLTFAGEVLLHRTSVGSTLARAQAALVQPVSPQAREVAAEIAALLGDDE